MDEGAFSAKTIHTFCVLNEPAGWYDDIWNTCYWDYYPATYGIIREYFDSGTNINIQQAFKAGSNFDNLMTSDPTDGVMSYIYAHARPHSQKPVFNT